LMSQVTQLTDQFEEGKLPRWWVSDAPTEYVEQQLKAIVGVEISIASIEGKAKLSQNRLDEDRESVKQHLSDGSLAEQNVSRFM